MQLLHGPHGVVYILHWNICHVGKDISIQQCGVVDLRAHCVCVCLRATRRVVSGVFSRIIGFVWWTRLAEDGHSKVPDPASRAARRQDNSL